MSTAKARPAYKTEKVQYDDGKIVNIMRCSAENMDMLMDLQDRLIDRYVESDGAIGKYFTAQYKDDLESDLRAICNLIPLVEKTKTGEVQFLDYDSIKDNWEQLVALFFNSEISDENRTLTSMSPSKISQLHFLPYNEMVTKYVTQMRARQRNDD